MNKQQPNERALYARIIRSFPCRAGTPPTQMEDHYTAVVLKNSNQSLPRGRGRGRGRPASPRKKGGRGKSPRKRGGGGSSKGSRKGGSKSRSKSPSKGGRKKKGKKGIRKRGAGAGGKRRSGGTGEPSSNVTKRVYASAEAFMTEHFPSEERQVRVGVAAPCLRRSIGEGGRETVQYRNMQWPQVRRRG